MNRPGIVLCTLVAFATLTALTGSVSAQEKSKQRTTKASAASVAPVNLNTATQAQLETLPGIGASAAKRIIEYRQKNGGFKKVEELMNVKGIGEKSFLKLKSHITVAAASPATDK